MQVVEWLRPGQKGEPARSPSIDQPQLLSSQAVWGGGGGGGRVVTSDYKGMARKQEKKRRGLEATITRKPAQFLDLSSGNSFPLAAWGCFQGAGVPGALRHR